MTSQGGKALRLADNEVPLGPCNRPSPRQSSHLNLEAWANDSRGAILWLLGNEAKTRDPQACAKTAGIPCP